MHLSPQIQISVKGQKVEERGSFFDLAVFGCTSNFFFDVYTHKE